jgi:hypothetical protein
MLSAPVTLFFVLVAGVADLPAVTADPPPRSEVSISVVTGTPPVLPGLATGIALEGQHHAGRRPLFLAARLQWSDAAGANENWIIDHQQFVVAAAVGLAATVGVARLWGELGGGAAGLRESVNRHPIDQTAGVPGGSNAFTVGPYAFGEAGVALVLRGWVRAFIAAGPTASRTEVDGAGQWRFGALGRLGITYDF